MFPYTENVIHEFGQGIVEITDFKLIHEYIFAIVREFYFVVFNLQNLFCRKIVTMNLHCLFHTKGNHLLKLNLYQQWMEMR